MRRLQRQFTRKKNALDSIVTAGDQGALRVASLREIRESSSGTGASGRSKESQWKIVAVEQAQSEEKSEQGQTPVLARNQGPSAPTRLQPPARQSPRGSYLHKSALGTQGARDLQHPESAGGESLSLELLKTNKVVHWLEKQVEGLKREFQSLLDVKFLHLSDKVAAAISLTEKEGARLT